MTVRSPNWPSSNPSKLSGWVDEGVWIPCVCVCVCVVRLYEKGDWWLGADVGPAIAVEGCRCVARRAWNLVPPALSGRRAQPPGDYELHQVRSCGQGRCPGKTPLGVRQGATRLAGAQQQLAAPRCPARQPNCAPDTNGVPAPAPLASSLRKATPFTQPTRCLAIYSVCMPAHHRMQGVL